MANYHTAFNFFLPRLIFLFSYLSLLEEPIKSEAANQRLINIFKHEMRGVEEVVRFNYELSEVEELELTILHFENINHSVSNVHEY